MSHPSGMCKLWLRVGVVALLGAAGCSTMSSRQEPFSYDRMKQQIEGPNREAIRSTVRQTAPKTTPTHSLRENKSNTWTDNFKRLTGQGPKPDKARGLYAEAEDLYRRAVQASGEDRVSLFHEAGDTYAAAAKAWPDSSLEQDALFLAGESYFFADKLPASNHQFELLLKKHPNSRYIDLVEARRFAMAQYWLAAAEHHGDQFFSVNIADKRRPWRDTRGHALRVFDRIRIDDPTGKLADDATMAAGNAYFAHRKFVRADEFYSDLRKTFPSSEHQFLAHYLGAQAKLRSYEGPDYSGVPLDEAEELLKQIRRQFPAEFEKNREDLERMYAEVRFRQAERDWSTAQYYERQKAFGAARFYYDLVIKDYPDTPFAEASRTRTGEIAAYPARPEQKFEWLVDQFPRSDESKPLVATGHPPSMKR